MPDTSPPTRPAPVDARLQAVLDSLPDAVYVYDAAWRWAYLNPAARALLGQLGQDPEAAIGRVVWDALPRLRGSEFERAARRARAEGVVVTYEEYVAVYDAWFEQRLVPGPDDTVTVYSRDVSERRRAVAARRAAEARLERVLMQTPAAVAVLLGPDHVVHSRNEMFLRLLGRRDYVGRPAREAAPELGAQGFLPLLDEVYRTGVPYADRETPLVWDRDGDGTRVEALFDLVYQPLVDAGGAVEGVLVFAVDVTAQVRARQAVEALNRRLAEQQAALARQAEELRTTAATLRGFLDSAPVLMGVVELVPHDGADDGTCDDILHVYDNPATDRFFGAAPGSTAGRLASALGVPAATIALWARYYREAEASGTPVAFEYTLDGVHADAESGAPGGATRWLAVTVGVAGAGPSGRTRFTYVAEDATARKRAEAERERLLAAERAARAEAEAASRAKSNFLAVMSHELRTPLNAIGGYAELMELEIRGPVTAQQREDLARIQKSQRHLLALIDEVLSYARLERGAVSYHIADVPVIEAVAAAEALVAPQLRAKGLDFAVAECDASVTVRADRDKLRQILVNLLGNAVKFTNARAGLPGCVEVVCEPSDERTVRIAVRDTGIGIPARKLEAIFEPFVQVDAALTRPHGGAGLGLAISRDLARGMGGDLTVESEVGVGSTFTLTLLRPRRPTP